jgi:hypothetical protein
MNAIKQIMFDLWSAWLEARAEQIKYYNKHSHIE